MSPDRNEICPCGSGKKFKKCCGGVPLGQDLISQNRTIAYVGDIGRRREQFCENYAAYKTQMISRGEQLIRDKVAAAGETISCREGCNKCCNLYVFANLQEAECIVNYLYRHDDALKHFLSAYGEWRKGLGGFRNKMDRLERMVGKSLTGRLAAQELERFQADIHAYTMCQLQCPFLRDGKCTIYEVRPFVCARLAATTPPEECQLEDPASNRAKYHKFAFKIEEDMPYFIQTRERIVSGCAPELVHRILEGGYSYLGSIAGLEELRHQPPVV